MKPLKACSRISNAILLEVAAEFSRVVVDYFERTRHGSDPVSTALSPSELALRFREPLPTSGRPIAQVIRAIGARCTAQQQSPFPPAFHGSSGVGAPCLGRVDRGGDGGAQPICAVWEMSPVGTVIETQVLRWMCELARLGPNAGGTFTSGGTEATFAGLLAARHAAFPMHEQGCGCDVSGRGCGEHAHYGVARAVGELGLEPTISECAVARLPNGRASARTNLGRAQCQSSAVMAVVATAGTTATGSFDDLEAIGKLCEHEGTGCTSMERMAHRRCCPLRTARDWRHPTRAIHRMGSPQNDVDAAVGQRGAGSERAGP